ncbi:unnamed protein product, partial [Symbiodinium sp. KB8]
MLSLFKDLELQQRWTEFIEEEEVARTEYGKYFEEQEKYKQELRADRDRLLGKELRMEGHFGPASSTSPTRTEIHEFSDRAYFDMMTQEGEAQEGMEENENEHYTQSFEYISEEEAGEPWQEEEEHTAEEEQPQEDKESHGWKFYTENGSIWKQDYRTGEKLWWNYDYKYKHQKGRRVLGKDGRTRVPKGVFGLADAPREWYKRLVRELESLGWSKGCVDEAVFLKWEAGKLTGVLIAHVDDMVMAGSLSAKKSLEELGLSGVRASGDPLKLVGAEVQHVEEPRASLYQGSVMIREDAPSAIVHATEGQGMLGQSGGLLGVLGLKYRFLHQLALQVAKQEEAERTAAARALASDAARPVEDLGGFLDVCEQQGHDAEHNKTGPGSKRQLLKTKNAAFKKHCSYSGQTTAAKQTTRLVDVVQQGLPQLLLLPQKQAEMRLRQEGVLSPPSWLLARGQADQIYIAGCAVLPWSRLTQHPNPGGVRHQKGIVVFAAGSTTLRTSAQDVFGPFYSGILNSDDKFFLTTAFGVGRKLGVDQMMHVLKEKDQSSSAVITKIKRFRLYHLVALGFSEVHRAATHKFSYIMEPDTARTLVLKGGVNAAEGLLGCIKATLPLMGGAAGKSHDKEALMSNLQLGPREAYVPDMIRWLGITAFQAEGNCINVQVRGPYFLAPSLGTPVQGQSVARQVPGREGPWEALLIGDYFVLSAEKAWLPPSESTAAAKVSQACSLHKDVDGADFFLAAGAQLNATDSPVSEGRVYVSTPVPKLLALSLKTAALPVITEELASNLAGSWISVVMYRRSGSSTLSGLASSLVIVLPGSASASALRRWLYELGGEVLSLPCCVLRLASQTKRINAFDTDAAVTNLRLSIQLVFPVAALNKGVAGLILLQLIALEATKMPCFGPLTGAHVHGKFVGLRKACYRFPLSSALACEAKPLDAEMIADWLVCEGKDLYGSGAADYEEFFGPARREDQKLWPMSPQTLRKRLDQVWPEDNLRATGNLEIRVMVAFPSGTKQMLNLAQREGYDSIVARFDNDVEYTVHSIANGCEREILRIEYVLVKGT